MNFLQTSKKSIPQLLGPNHRSPLIDLDDYANTNWKYKAWSTVGRANPFPFKIKSEEWKASLQMYVGTQRPAWLRLSKPRWSWNGREPSWAKTLVSPTHLPFCRAGYRETLWSSTDIHSYGLNLKCLLQAHSLKAWSLTGHAIFWGWEVGPGCRKQVTAIEFLGVSHSWCLPISLFASLPPAEWTAPLHLILSATKTFAWVTMGRTLRNHEPR